MEMALDNLGNRPLHVSYDIDACDPQIAPCTGTAVPGGLSSREAHYIVDCVAETGSLVSMDMVEVNTWLTPGVHNPGLSQKAAADRTVKLALSLIDTAFGSRLL